MIIRTFIAALLFATPAIAHEGYDYRCCGQNAALAVLCVYPPERGF